MSGQHAHATGIPPENKADLVRRLARVRGQVEGVQRMIEEERYCPEIMQQFAAVHAGLRSAENVLFASHLEGCASHGIEQGGEAARQVREELVHLFSRYGK